MKKDIFVDPLINMSSSDMITVIIQFKTKPAQEAMAISQKSGQPITLEKAKWAVEQSHLRFQEDVKKHLVSKKIPFTINHVYKSALNGVSMSLPANNINTLLLFNEIESIHANQEYHIDPPNMKKFYQ
ncbi:protease inhibitor I9 family protein [Pseudoneobacillus sp. C159]